MRSPEKENSAIEQLLLDPTSQSRHYLQQLISSNSTARHSLTVCMLSTMQNAWQTNQRAGQDNLELHLADFYPVDLYNLYMLLWSLESEAV